MDKQAQSSGWFPKFDSEVREKPVPEVKEVVGRVLNEQSQRAVGFGPAYELLWEELSVTARGGKNFRGHLVTSVHAGFGGVQRASAAYLGAAFELLHAGFLVHDDLIDHDTHRRGAPNLAASMRGAALGEGATDRSADHLAEASAVLAGDLAITLAHRLLATIEAPADVRSALADLMWSTIFVSVAGELDDVVAAHGLWEVSLERALQTAASKTAYYSFQAPLLAGALLAGASEEALTGLDVVGRALGKAFQLTDDLLGVFAPEELTGKSQISDLREGKATTLILHARNLPVWERIGHLVGRPDLDADTACQIRRLLAASSAPVRVEQQARLELAAALRAVEGEAALAPVADELIAAWEMVSGRLETAMACVNVEAVDSKKSIRDGAQAAEWTHVSRGE